MKTIRELLTGRRLVTLASDASALDAAQAMDRERIGAILITGKGGEPLGIFTERDLVTRVIVRGLQPKEVRIREVMTRELFTAAPDRRINEVARELQDRHIRHLPVVEDGHVIGMLSLRDLLREHLAVKRGEVQALTAYIQGGGEPPSA